MLLLFDIDGTLLSGAAREHAAALMRALTDVYGVAGPAAKVDPAGRTDLEIARAILMRSGVSAERIDAGLADLRSASCEEYARRCPPSLAGCVVPGVEQLLSSLAARPGVVLALVTGNLEPIARLKLARAGIGHHFEPGQGAFGSDSEDRTELPAIARHRAGRTEEGRVHPYPRQRTIVIGDTPRDIACARADGVRCIAVTTGPYGAAALRRADAVAEDAGHLGVLLDAELAAATGR